LSRGVQHHDCGHRGRRQLLDDEAACKRVRSKLFAMIRDVQALAPRFDDVNAIMTELASEGRETQASLHETYSAIQQLNQAAQDLKHAMTRFKVN